MSSLWIELCSEFRHLIKTLIRDSFSASGVEEEEAHVAGRRSGRRLGRLGGPPPGEEARGSPVRPLQGQVVGSKPDI